jgi:transcriptional regulator with XRE-family HTH domain
MIQLQRRLSPDAVRRLRLDYRVRARIRAELENGDPTAPYRAFREPILRALLALGWSLQTVARMGGLPGDALGYFVGTPGSRLTRPVVRAIAPVLGLNPDDLVALACYGKPRQGSVRTADQALVDGCAICACPDCRASGQRCVTPGAKYVAGHHLRDPEWMAQHTGHSGWRRRGRKHYCAVQNCRVYRWLPPSRASKAKRWNDLLGRCADYIKEHGLTISAFCEMVGTSTAVLNQWRRGAGRRVPRVLIERLAELFEMPYDDALAEAGGETAEDVKTAKGKRLSALSVAARKTLEGQTRFAAGHRKGAAARRGGKQSPEHTAKVVRALTENGTYDRLRERSRQTNGQVRQALVGWLNGNPTPTREELIRRAEDVGKRYGQLPVESVLPIWRPGLERHGLGDLLAPATPESGHPARGPNKGGRPRNEKRQRLVLHLMDGWARKTDGDLVDGFWPMALERVTALEGAKAPKTIDSLQLWWRDQKRAARGRDARDG